MKLSIIGTGKIAHEVIKALRDEATDIEISSIFAHSNKNKADEIARQYGIPNVYVNYERLLKHDNADFIYIGLVNSAHYEYAKEALLARRNVILEKPFTSAYQEAVELATIARERGLWLFEAVTTLHLPNYNHTKDLLKQVGPVRIVRCNYSQYSSRYDRYLKGDVAPAFNPQLGGGALNDLNIYNINAVVGLFGKPVSTQYFANRGFNGVDTSGILIMQYLGFIAECAAAKDSGSPSSFVVQGEQGTIIVPSAPNEMSRVVLSKNNGNVVYQDNKYTSRLVHEFKDFEQIWESNDYDAMNHYLDISLTVMQVVEMDHQKVNDKSNNK